MRALYGLSTRVVPSTPDRLEAFIALAQMAVFYGAVGQMTPAPSVNPEVAAQLRLLRAMERARQEQAK